MTNEAPLPEEVEVGEHRKPAGVTAEASLPFGTTAYGGHQGNCNPNFPNQDSFSVASLFEEAIGARVICGFC